MFNFTSGATINSGAKRAASKVVVTVVAETFLHPGAQTPSASPWGGGGRICLEK